MIEDLPTRPRETAEHLRRRHGFDRIPRGTDVARLHRAAHRGEIRRGAPTHVHSAAELEDVKLCPRCGETKARATGFTTRSNGRIFSWCKACNADYKREKAAERARARTDH